MRASVSSACWSLVAGLAATLVSLAIGRPAMAETRDLSVAAQIKQIETALLPPVLVDGESPRPASLLDRMAELHVPAVSIAVVHDGKIAWAHAFGVTKLGGRPATPHTLFQAASISKPITALAVLHLAQLGKVDLDADVNGYLKSWKLPSNEFTARHPVTLRELLTHTAGITVHGFPGYAANEPLPTLVQVLNGVAPSNTAPIRVDTIPGTGWRYSGGGYVIVQQVLEDVTGRPFYRLMNDTVLAPIGMKDSTFEQPLAEGRMKDVAVPYRSNGTPVKGGSHVYPERAPAGLWTTPSDLARYIIEVQHALSGESNRVLTSAMTNEMLTPVSNAQGLGPRAAGTSPHRYFQHSGANEGYQCLLIGYEDGNGMVIMTNGDNGGSLFFEVVRTIAHQNDWPEFQPPVHKVAGFDSQQFDLLAGTYQLAPNFVVTFSRDHDLLFAQASGRGPVEIFSDTAGAFFSKSTDVAFTFDVDAQRRGTGVTFRQNDRILRGARLDDEQAKAIAEEFARINKRVRDQAPVPGGDRVVRKLFDQIAAGTPDYSGMGAEFANVTRQQLPGLQKDIAALGAITSIVFQDVSANGADTYAVTCAQGKLQVSIAMSSDGKIQGAEFNRSD
jgi:CubicO group peptidase (beta-lactamase class C family)